MFGSMVVVLLVTGLNRLIAMTAILFSLLVVEFLAPKVGSKIVAYTEMAMPFDLPPGLFVLSFGVLGVLGISWYILRKPEPITSNTIT